MHCPSCGEILELALELPTPQGYPYTVEFELCGHCLHGWVTTYTEDGPEIEASAVFDRAVKVAQFLSENDCRMNEWDIVEFLCDFIDEWDLSERLVEYWLKDYKPEENKDELPVLRTQTGNPEIAAADEVPAD